ncbi:hypothetical protein HHI36_019151 [Cryptolaemus montrouzieri]|uniref:Uncharacterized protein n=1 Tax=Cryptolaemus montrouzieri TaxID=559131 RepID=A0ABD2P2R8_9CUCU
MRCFGCSYLLMFVCFVPISTFASADATQNLGSSELKEQLRVLSKQVTTLMDRRREDLDIIEENMRKKLYQTPELVEIKEALKALRRDVDSARFGTSEYIHPQSTSSSTEEKNERLTVKWLSNSVSELKTELGEVQAAVNSTKILQNHEQLDSELSLLRSDVTNLNRQLEMAKSKNEKFEATLQMLQEEMAVLKEFNKATATSCGKLKHQENDADKQWIIFNQISIVIANRVFF